MQSPLKYLTFFLFVVIASSAFGCHKGDFESTAKGHHKWGKKVGLFQFTENTTITSLTSFSCDVYIAFLDDQYEFIQEQVAHGSGPHIDALSKMTGCDERVRFEFAKTLRGNYIRLFSDQKNPQILRDEIEKLIVSNSTLKLSCIKV
tara:strand:+ start:729 stop:1169 length:441 start_codon:yes stop_codon:yes gene_type:complete